MPSLRLGCTLATAKAGESRDTCRYLQSYKLGSVRNCACMSLVLRGSQHWKDGPSHGAHREHSRRHHSCQLRLTTSAQPFHYCQSLGPEKECRCKIMAAGCSTGRPNTACASGTRSWLCLARRRQLGIELLWSERAPLPGRPFEGHQPSASPCPVQLLLEEARHEP